MAPLSPLATAMVRALLCMQNVVDCYDTTL